MATVTKPVLLDETGQAINASLASEGNAIADAIQRVASAISGQKGGTIYGIHINGAESDPDAAVTYLADAAGMTPAKMNFTAGTFDYGSWQNAFYQPRPCMVKYDGTVDYYLDPDDYTKKEDGTTASDVGDTTYAGNAMMEWGQNGKKIWLKIVPTSADGTSGDVYVADFQADPDFHDWPFHNCDGVSVPHFYTPIFNGANIDSKLRSLSGQALVYGKTAQEELDLAHANNTGEKVLWETEVFADIQLINILHYLMFKTLDVPSKLGLGFTSSNESGMKAWRTGALNDKGLFFGYNDGTHAVKSFGMENWWGMQWRRYLGHIMVNGVQKVKLTRNTEDGSTVNGYNLTGEGYITEGVTPTGTSGDFIKQMIFTPEGMFPKATGGSQTTYYCDKMWYSNSITAVPSRGAYAGDGLSAGVAAVYLYNAASAAVGGRGASLSCKPLAT